MKKSEFQMPISSSSDFNLTKSPRIKRRYSSLDSSFDSENSDDDDEDEDNIEIQEVDDQIHLEANVSYEFTKFMEDPLIHEGRSKHTMLLPNPKFVNLHV